MKRHPIQKAEKQILEVVCSVPLPNVWAGDSTRDSQGLLSKDFFEEHGKKKKVQVFPWLSQGNLQPVTLCRELVSASLTYWTLSNSCHLPTDQRSLWKLRNHHQKYFKIIKQKLKQAFLDQNPQSPKKTLEACFGIKRWNLLKCRAQTAVGPEGKVVTVPWCTAVSFYYLPLAEDKPEKAQLVIHNRITATQCTVQSLTCPPCAGCLRTTQQMECLVPHLNVCHFCSLRSKHMDKHKYPTRESSSVMKQETITGGCQYGTSKWFAQVILITETKQSRLAVQC